MAPDTCKTEISANTLLSQPYGSQIGDLADIGATGTRKDQNFIRLTKAFFFHFFPFSPLESPAACPVHHAVQGLQRG
jgi:hypothetical protein